MFPCIYYPKLEKTCLQFRLHKRLFIGGAGIYHACFWDFYCDRAVAKECQKIIELEKEMLRNHAEIIDLHRQIDLIKINIKPGATILKLNDSSIDDAQNGLSEVVAERKC
jgi:hypothetical protein